MKRYKNSVYATCFALPLLAFWIGSMTPSESKYSTDSGQGYEVAIEDNGNGTESTSILQRYKGTITEEEEKALLYFFDNKERFEIISEYISDVMPNRPVYWRISKSENDKIVGLDTSKIIIQDQNIRRDILELFINSDINCISGNTDKIIEFSYSERRSIWYTKAYFEYARLNGGDFYEHSVHYKTEIEEDGFHVKKIEDGWYLFLDSMIGL